MWEVSWQAVKDYYERRTSKTILFMVHDKKSPCMFQETWTSNSNSLLTRQVWTVTFSVLKQRWQMHLVLCISGSIWWAGNYIYFCLFSMLIREHIDIFFWSQHITRLCYITNFKRSNLQTDHVYHTALRMRNGRLLVVYSLTK